jgi:hypothetical protein
MWIMFPIGCPSLSAMIDPLAQAGTTSKNQRAKDFVHYLPARPGLRHLSEMLHVCAADPLGVRRRARAGGALRRFRSWSGPLRSLVWALTVPGPVPTPRWCPAP